LVFAKNREKVTVGEKGGKTRKEFLRNSGPWGRGEKERPGKKKMSLDRSSYLGRGGKRGGGLEKKGGRGGGIFDPRNGKGKKKKKKRVCGKKRGNNQEGKKKKPKKGGEKKGGRPDPLMVLLAKQNK